MSVPIGRRQVEAREARAPALPGRGGRRVLVEAADPWLARRCAVTLRRAGFDVSACDGQSPGGGGCPLLSGEACPLVDAADLVVHGLPGDAGQAVLRGLLDAGPPVLVVTGGQAAPAAGGGEAVAAGAEPPALVEAARRLYAGRARRLRMPLCLRDGRVVGVRAIAGSDADLLCEFDGRLSETSRRFRYLGWKPPLEPESAARMAGADFRDRFAIVATSDETDRQVIVADCRLVPIDEHPGSAEVAIAVADDFQDSGLGRALLQLMLGVAADRGLVQVVAEVRYDNVRMMHLLRELGFRRTAWEYGVVTFVAEPAGG